MTTGDWLRVIEEAAAFAVGMVQFIGGEPTLHPDFAVLLTAAVDAGLRTEVYTNLVHVRPEWWDLFGRDGVSLATSYYSDQARQHERVTGRRGSHARTRANIAEAVRRGIPIRAGIIDIDDGQRVAQAQAELEDLGVTDAGVDRLRQVGRGIRDATPAVAQLCGGCGQGVAAVSADGSVWPCVFSRWLPVGNVRSSALAQIWTGPLMTDTAARLAEEFMPQRPCAPDQCHPRCGPMCSPACNPQGCNPNCRPQYGPCKPDSQLCNPERNCKPNQCRPAR
jgi:MoaA/NifB/PqqE/SkfB family radical SAM enzyme